MAICYLGIGSNLGNRRKNIMSAIQEIGSIDSTRVLKRSRIIETAPVAGPKGQGKFLNAALKIQTRLTPLRLLYNLKKIEKSMGRPQNSVRNGPRIIDLDILFYADRIIKNNRLIVPHPRMLGRPFVITPLMEVINGKD